MKISLNKRNQHKYIQAQCKAEYVLKNKSGQIHINEKTIEKIKC